MKKVHFDKDLDMLVDEDKKPYNGRRVSPLLTVTVDLGLFSKMADNWEEIKPKFTKLIENAGRPYNADAYEFVDGNNRYEGGELISSQVSAVNKVIFYKS